MFFARRVKCIFFALILTISGVWQTSQAIVPLFLLAAKKLTEQKDPRNLILVIDVKQQEMGYLGACGYILATGLQDKVSPLIASAHSLAYVTSYFKPHEWDIYKKDNLVFFLPHDYLKNHKIKDAEHAGFDLDGWRRIDLNKEFMTGKQLHTFLAPQQTAHLPFADLSHDSVVSIFKTLKKDKKNAWKIYAVGHGAPDAHQVAGLNLKDFQILLDELQSRSTDFFVYQTCFGGSTNQLREVYLESQGSCRKFNFPIISGALTNSVSYGMHPSAGTSFNELFARVNGSMIVEKKMTELLKAVNKVNKGLDLAADYHWSNNLLLVRMPGKEFFEPVADNKLVFNLTEFNVLERGGRADTEDKNFKCMLVNHPILDQVYDFSSYSNFMIASGISRPDHYIREVKLAKKKASINETYFEHVLDRFNSLAHPHLDKNFYVPTIKIGDQTVLTDVTITQERTDYTSNQTTLSISGMLGGSFYKGQANFYVYKGRSDLEYSTISLGDKSEAEEYRAQYEKTVNKHLKKQHQYPLYIPQHAIFA